MEKRVPIIVEVSQGDFDTSDAQLIQAIGQHAVSSNEDKTSDASATDVGAVVSFIGKVRGTERTVDAGRANDNRESKRRLLALKIEHYPEMTEASIRQICEQAARRWQLLGCLVIHRTGHLAVGENIVKVLVASEHRHDAFMASQFIMDYLKTEVPLWKKAVYSDGEHWIAVKASDAAPDAKWRN